MIPLVIVRPEPGASATLETAHAMGLDARAHPIFTVEAVPWAAIPREDVDAVLLGSANALRHGGPQLERLRGLPAYCVGQTTAIAATSAGLDVVKTGSGGLQNVLDALDPAHRRLLRLAGEAHVPLELPVGVSMETLVIYATRALPMEERLASVLSEPAVVMLHSGEAASHFDALCAAAAIDRSRLALATIGPRVTAVAGDGWARIETADRPSDAALLALAFAMCQDVEAPPPYERPDAGR